MNPLKQSLVGLAVVTSLGLAWAGCGGGGDGDVATGENGNVIRTAGGAAVSEEAHNHWTEAIAMFRTNDGEEGTWNTQTCQAHERQVRAGQQRAGRQLHRGHLHDGRGGRPLR